MTLHQQATTTDAVAAAPPAPVRRRRVAPSSPVLGALGILLFLAVWEMASRSGIVNSRYLPPATEVIAALVRNAGLTAFWVAVGETVFAWALGLVIAVVLALIAGFVIGSSAVLRRFTHSTIEFLRPIPSVALIPLAVLLFGVQIESTLMLVVYASFWQVLIQVLYGVADVDNVALQTAKSYGLGPVARVRYVVFPTTLPFLMTGVRLAAAVALILAVTAELIIGSPGLGNEIALAQSGGAVSALYALVVATGLIGVAINLFMRWAERKMLSWHSSVRSEVPA